MTKPHYAPLTRLRTPGQGTRYTMDSIAQTYRTAHLGLRLKQKKWTRGAQHRIDILNEFYDTKNAMPPGVDLQDFNPGLAAHGLANEAQCSEFHIFSEHTKTFLSTARKFALSAIGAYFGTQMAADPRGTRLEKFRRYWCQANTYRAAQLDGIRFQGIAHDPCGPTRVPQLNL